MYGHGTRGRPERCRREALEINRSMERTALSIAWIVLAYLLGSLPLGVLLSRLKGQDPRKVGSGNIGATNVMRAAGKTLGAVTLIGDALKGFLPVSLAIWFGLPGPVVAASGLAAFVGHLFPIYLGFKGGKGIATALGIFLALNPFAVLIAIAVFALVLDKWRYVSLGSLVGTVLMPFLLLALGRPGPTPPCAWSWPFSHSSSTRRISAGYAQGPSIK